jgi:uncharacterized membrane protein
MLALLPPAANPSHHARRRVGFSEDFRRFFTSGMAALLPTLITLWLLIKIWNFLWDSIGQHIIFGIRWIWNSWSQIGLVPFRPPAQIGMALDEDRWWVRVLGVMLAVLLIYIVGVFVGNFIGRTFYRIAERAVMRIPLVRAVYPAVKQVTDFFLDRRQQNQFAGSRVVAVQPHEQGIWSIGLITGPGLPRLSEAAGEEMVTVFVPSTPTAFTGYVLVVPRKNVVELPLKVEEAMRLLISGGVVSPVIEPPKLADSQPLAVSQTPAIPNPEPSS